MFRVIRVVRVLLRPRVRWVFLLAGGLLAGWVASAGGAVIPPLPTVPTTVQVPTLPLPAPPPPVQVPPAPVPVPRAPVPPAPVAVPPVPVVSPVAQQSSQPVGTLQSGGAGGASGGAGAASGPASTRAASASPDRSAGPGRVYRMRLSRDWIARKGPKRHRGTTLVFVLRRPALVEFVVVQVYPECRRVGRFRVRGEAGRNRVVFRGRVGRTVLAPGTYSIRAKAGRHRVVDARFVVVSRRDRGEIASARSANACSGAVAATAAASSFAGAAGGGSIGSKGPGAEQRSRADPTARAGSRSTKGALGARFAREAVDQVASIPRWLFAVLGLAIVLLAVAALPLHATPSPKAAAILARRRGVIAMAGAVIAMAGAATLTVVTIAYALH